MLPSVLSDETLFLINQVEKAEELLLSHCQFGEYAGTCGASICTTSRSDFAMRGIRLHVCVWLVYVCARVLYLHCVYVASPGRGYFQS